MVDPLANDDAAPDAPPSSSDAADNKNVTFKIEDDDMDEELVLDMSRASLRERNGGGSNAALEIDSKAITIV